jgi:nicotinate phosphoribosyltransferase
MEPATAMTVTALTPYTAFATDTDEYCLTMPRTYFRERMNDVTSFNLFVRSLPANYGYLVAAGLDDLLRYLENLRFTDAELDALTRFTVDPFDPSSPRLYEDDFLGFLADLRFTGDVYAMREGTPFYAGEPVARIVAPRIEATIIEPAALSIINRQSAVATKAARMVSVAQGRALWEAGLRRAPGPETGPANARAAYIGGMVGTSNVRAAMVHGIPSTGTSAHAYVMRWNEDDEQIAFETWLRNNPYRASVLVDTYNIARGVQRAIAASHNVGIPLATVRIDSGNLTMETQAARKALNEARGALDDAGMHDTVVLDSIKRKRTGIMPTGDMDEYTIGDLLAAGGQMDSSYSGTALVNPGPIGGVYKLGYQEVDDLHDRWVIKKAAGKATDPGRHQVWRHTDGYDVISMSDEIIPGAQPLLSRVMTAGERVGPSPTLAEIRDYAMAQVAALPDAIRAVREPVTADVRRSDKLWKLRAALGDQIAVDHLNPQPAAESAVDAMDEHTAAWVNHYTPALLPLAA